MTPTYQDVVVANGAIAAWAFSEASGTDFAPYIGGTHLTGASINAYQQAGPFASAFALKLINGSTLRMPFVNQLIPPTTRELWFKLNALGPASNQLIFYDGNQSANGSGLYIAANNHVHFYAGGVVDTDTGFVWPDTNWHLVQLVSTDSTHSTFYFDGIGKQNITWTPTAPSPNGSGWLCDDSAYACKTTAFISYPAIYQNALTAKDAYASFVAATDPTTALNYVLSGTGQTYTNSQIALLLADCQSVLSAVQKTFPRTP